MAGLDYKMLYAIKDCVEWRNEALVHGVIEIKEILHGLKLVDEIIQGDLKWFNKHCVGKENDFVAQVEEIINEVQKKFQEIQEKKAPTR